MLTTNELQQKSAEILEVAHKIGIEHVLISEQKGEEQSKESEYVTPFLFIIDTGRNKDLLDNEQRTSFRDYLRSLFEHPGIEVFSKHTLESNVLNSSLLKEDSKHYLDSALDITQVKIDTEKSWKVQFEEQRATKIGLSDETTRDASTNPTKKRRLDQPSAITSLVDAAPINLSQEIDVEAIRARNSDLEETLKMIMENKNIIMPSDIRQKLQKQFPDLATSQQTVK